MIAKECKKERKKELSDIQALIKKYYLRKIRLLWQIWQERPAFLQERFQAN